MDSLSALHGVFGPQGSLADLGVAQWTPGELGGPQETSVDPRLSAMFSRCGGVLG